jgi:hypothetical protein
MIHGSRLKLRGWNGRPFGKGLSIGGMCGARILCAEVPNAVWTSTPSRLVADGEARVVVRRQMLELNVQDIDRQQDRLMPCEAPSIGSCSCWWLSGDIPFCRAQRRLSGFRLFHRGDQARNSPEKVFSVCTYDSAVPYAASLADWVLP